MEQRSAEWFAARLGKVTASRINDVMDKLKSGSEKATRKNYRAQVLCERLTGQKEDSFCNAAMQWGIDNEDPARECYEFLTGLPVSEVGLVDHPSIPMAAASPDGLVNASGLVEIKCPNTANHIEWMLAGVVPAQHIKQIQFQLACTDRKWCDFISYDPRLPEELQLFVVRLERDDELIAEIEESVIKFNAEVDETLEKLTKIREAA